MKQLLLLIGLLFCFSSFGQNRPHYSLYMLRQNVVNPAAVCTQDAISVAFLGNTQINGFAGNPRTYGLDLIAPIGKSGLVAGANVGQDKIGVTTRSNFGGTLAYRLKLATDHYLSFGVNAIGVQYSATYTDLVVNDMSDPIYMENTINTFSYDISSGLYYFTNNFYLGFGTMNLTDLYYENIGSYVPSTRVNPENIHFVGQMGYQHKLGKNWKVMPSILYKGIKGSPDQFDFNIQMNYKDIIGFGPMFRSANSFAFQVNSTISKSLQLGYSYNMGTGFKTNTNFSGHEIMLLYKVKNSKQRLPIDIPRF